MRVILFSIRHSLNQLLLKFRPLKDALFGKANRHGEGAAFPVVMKNQLAAFSGQRCRLRHLGNAGFSQPVSTHCALPS